MRKSVPMLVDIIESLQREFSDITNMTHSQIQYTFTGKYKVERGNDRTLTFEGELSYIKGQGAGGACFSPEPEERGRKICNVIHDKAAILSRGTYKFEKISGHQFKLKTNSLSEDEVEKELEKIRQKSKPTLEIYKI